LYRSLSRRIAFVAAGTALAMLALAGCVGAGAATGPSTLSPGNVTHDASATLTIWTDAARKPGFDAYQKAHPGVKMNIVTIDDSQILTKIQLANKAKSGWPDVIYPLTTSYTPLLASKQYGNFLQPLDGLYPDSLLKGFGTSLDACTVDGHLYCLRNDVAPSVLFYNTKTMSELGYSVPTTMKQYLSIAEDIAKNHPGYVVQGPASVPAQAIVDNYYASNNCPYAQDLGGGKMKIDLHDSRCTAVTDVVGKLIAAKVLPLAQLNQAQLQELGSTGKIAMTIDANWYADYVFAGSFKWPDGQLGVAPAPTWSGSKTYAGAEGGGGYVLSSHSKNMKSALDIIRFMSSNKVYQLSAGTLPAYEPLRPAWAETAITKNPIYATDTPDKPLDVYLSAAKNISPQLSWVKFNVESTFTQAVMPGLKEGKPLASLIDGWQTALVNAAKAAGYTVQQ